MDNSKLRKGTNTINLKKECNIIKYNVIVLINYTYNRCLTCTQSTRISQAFSHTQKDPYQYSIFICQS